MINEKMCKMVLFRRHLFNRKRGDAGRIESDTVLQDSNQESKEKPMTPRGEKRKMKILSFLLIGMLQLIVVRDWQGRNVIVDVSRVQHLQPQNIGMYMSNSHVPGHARPKPRTKKKTLRLGHCEKPSLSKGGTKKLRLSR